MAVTLTTYRLADGATRPTVVAINVPEARANLPYLVQRRVELMFRPGEVMATTYDLSGWVANHVLVVVPPVAPVTPAPVGVLEADPIVVAEVAAPVIVPVADPAAQLDEIIAEARAVAASEIADGQAPVVEPIVEPIPELATPTAPAPAALRALRQRGRK
jgi:hypothetical protein